MKSLAITAMLALLGLSACGSGAVQALAERNRTEAKHFQEQCARAGLVTDDTKRGDALLAKSEIDLKEGDEDGALQKSDLAVTMYRLALAKQELASMQTQVEALKQTLAKDQEQLATYREVLEEIKLRRKP